MTPSMLWVHNFRVERCLRYALRTKRACTVRFLRAEPRIGIRNKWHFPAKHLVGNDSERELISLPSHRGGLDLLRSHPGRDYLAHEIGVGIVKHTEPRFISAFWPRWKGVQIVVLAVVPLIKRSTAGRVEVSVHPDGGLLRIVCLPGGGVELGEAPINTC